jgi:hypothetical protein
MTTDRTITSATMDFERWLSRFVKLDVADLRYKHAEMAEDFFRFFRGTYYRWAQCWAHACPAAADAPRVLAVGDLHVENFGNWRDADGRLVWGVNDFDEAYVLPYTNDLIRLAVSGVLAAKSADLTSKPREICELILEGYRLALSEGGRPFVLEEEHPTLRALATSRLRQPALFWAKFNRNIGSRPTSQTGTPLRLMRENWPKESGSRSAPLVPQLRRRRGIGMGSLGKPRFVAVGEHAGGWVAREVKALTPSACAWATGTEDSTTHYQQILSTSVRCSDPFARPYDGWLVRRLAPDCSRIELATLEQVDDESHLLRAMGWETANIHLNAPGNAAKILSDLKKRPKGWLRDAAKTMYEVSRSDWKAWKSSFHL